MKILFISEAVLPSKHANSVAIINMCYGMAQVGHEVTLLGVQGNRENDLWKFYCMEPLPNFHIVYAPKKSRARSQKISILFQAAKLIPQNDLVYSRWNYAVRLSNFLRKKTVVEFHYLSPYPKKRKIDKKIIQSPYTCRVVCITGKVDEDFKQLGGHAEKFMIEPAAAQPDSTYDPNRSFIMECGYIGSFYEGKGIEIVLQIANKMPDIRFHIVGGSKTQQDALRQTYQVGENVIWYGYQPYNRTMEILDGFDIALLPNQKQVVVGGADIGPYTSPNKMFEYLSKGKIIVASDLRVLREILTDGENAILVAPNDVDAWVEAIRNILTDKERQRKLSMNGYQMIRNRYNWKDRAGRILDNLDIEERKS